MLNTFKDFTITTLDEQAQYLEEKLILYNNGKKEGQIVFMTGGAGSGKGFSIKNFIEGEKFKVRDVDEWKRIFIKLDKLKKQNQAHGRGGKGAFAKKLDGTRAKHRKQGGFAAATDKGKPFRRIDQRNAGDLFDLHVTIENMKIKDKMLKNLLKGKGSSGRLPNILFDMTGSKSADFDGIMPYLIEVGYQAKNIHVTWVLTNYSLAVRNNLDPDRARIVPDDVLFNTHEGAAHMMGSMAKTGKMPEGIDGRFDVILNNRENTIFFDSKGKGTSDIKQAVKGSGSGEFIIKGFKSINLKMPGKKMNKEDSLQNQLHGWIEDNIPKTMITAKSLGV